MPEIIEKHVGDVLQKLPGIVPFDTVTISKADLLICCAGFEERAAAVTKQITPDILGEGDVQIICYPMNEADNKKALDEILKTYESRFLEPITYDRRTFLKTFRDLVKTYPGDTNLEIVVDVSSMASFVLFRVFHVLFNVVPNANLTLIYNEAKVYLPSKEDWTTFYESIPTPDDNLEIAEQYEKRRFQSRGVKIPYISDVYAGRNPEPFATEIVAIPGFSYDRMKSMLVRASDEFGTTASNVSWFLGQPPDTQKNGWRLDAIASLYNVKNRGLAISTLHYTDAFRQLCEKWNECYTSRHLVIASIGSKMNNVGVFLFLEMHPECALMICEPEEFIPSEYSEGVGPSWILNFGKIVEVKNLLASYGNLEFNWGA